MVFKAAGNTNRIKSLPSRERGLKSIQVNILLQAIHVAPLAGAWIEIFQKGQTFSACPVAPLAGAWIEIKWLQRRTIVIDRRSPRGSVD